MLHLSRLISLASIDHWEGMVLFFFSSSTIDPDFLLVTFEFPTNYLDTETACQWQICNQQPLACQLSFLSEKYLDEPGKHQQKRCVWLEQLLLACSHCGSCRSILPMSPDELCESALHSPVKCPKCVFVFQPILSDWSAISSSILALTWRLWR